MDIHKLFNDFRQRPGMYTLGSYSEAAAFVMGADMATGGDTLEGFREWLVVKNDGGNNLAWSALVLDLAFPKRSDPESAPGESSDANRIAIEKLFGLIDEFLEDKVDRGLDTLNEEYQAWLQAQEWYDESVYRSNPH